MPSPTHTPHNIAPVNPLFPCPRLPTHLIMLLPSTSLPMPSPTHAPHNIAPFNLPSQVILELHTTRADEPTLGSPSEGAPDSPSAEELPPTSDDEEEDDFADHADVSARLRGPGHGSSGGAAALAARRLAMLCQRMQVLLSSSHKESVRSFFYPSPEGLAYAQLLMIRLWAHLLKQARSDCPPLTPPLPSAPSFMKSADPHPLRLPQPCPSPPSPLALCPQPHGDSRRRRHGLRWAGSRGEHGARARQSRSLQGCAQAVR
jgi:hypothetical protein